MYIYLSIYLSINISIYYIHTHNDLSGAGTPRAARRAAHRVNPRLIRGVDLGLRYIICGGWRASCCGCDV